MGDPLEMIISKMETGLKLLSSNAGAPSVPLVAPPVAPVAADKPAVVLDDNAAFEIHVYTEMRNQMSNDIEDIKSQIRALRAKIKDKLFDLEELKIELEQKELDIKLVWAKAGNDQAELEALEAEEYELSNRRENLSERIYNEAKSSFVASRKRAKVRKRDQDYESEESDKDYWGSD